MLFLLSQVGAERYAIPANRIIEVLPLVTISRLPQLRPAVAGLLHYHGTSVLVVDFGLLVGGQPAPSRLSTRLVLLNVQPPGGAARPLALISGKATEMISLPAGSFEATSERMSLAPYLGPVAWDFRGVVRRVEVDGLSSFLGAEALPAAA
jgi:chemotaxis-related protein WspB